MYPIDYANACPDVALTSLHYYFPWAMTQLVAWSVFCATTKRPVRVGLDLASWFEIADSDRTYDEKLAAYRALSDRAFDSERYREFRAQHLARLDEVVVEYVRSDDFDQLLVDTVASTFPPHEHAQFTAHYRGLLRAWADDQAAAAGR